MSDLSHITAADIEAELEPSAPYPICYFLLFEDKVIGVLYWDDLTHEFLGPMPGRFLTTPTPMAAGPPTMSSVGRSF
jgi:hypothetical protein